VINHKHANYRELLAACSPDRILVESDYNDIDMITSQTWAIIQVVSDVRGWPIETQWVNESELEEENWGTIRRLEKNWLRFKAGNHPVKQAKRRIKQRGFDSGSSGAEEIDN